ncbi:Histone-lysine N-methyltransferase ehmt1 [Aspergillus melleus]|uniref:Histone-lysine N-methyltransferase ehmt1 n=1 Tax=Aspergillus melleus TaxID=138277 RepID=A0ACC3B531_9EURO|nr:Histone-lysine N-methyltransferase ehmt1 [Aspergillus melleus]
MALLLVRNGASLESQDYEGRPPLMKAAKCGADRIVKFFLDRGAMPKARDNIGRTPLFHALEGGKASVIKLLFEPDSALLTCRDRFGCSPLLLAAETPRHDILELDDNHDHCEIIVSGVECVLRTIRGPGYTLSRGNAGVLFLWTSANGHLAVINHLPDNGFSDLCYDSVGRTPLMLAVKNNHLDVIKTLLKNRMWIEVRDRAGYSSLCWAFRNGNEVTTLMLLETVADPIGLVRVPRADKVACRHESRRIHPMFSAAQRGYKSIIDFLLNVGVNPSFQQALTLNDREMGLEDQPISMMLSPFANAAEYGYYAIVQALLERGANISVCQEGL